MSNSPPSLWFDAHLDLACLAVCGRDLTLPLDRLDPAAKPFPPPSITLPSLAEGRVRVALATIFLETLDAAPSEGPLGPEQYVMGDADRAARLGRAQLEVYLTWRDRGLVAMDFPRLFHADPGVGELRGGMGVTEALPYSLADRLKKANGPSSKLHVGLLIEGADCVRSPEELAWWKERGAVAVGLAWARASRYAPGNTTPRERDTGLADLGRAMVREIDRLGLVHDVSHLSDRAMDELFALTARPVMASHSNCRTLLNAPDNQRHLRDDSIREIARRGGVIGLNLFRNFIAPSPYTSMDPRPSIAQAINHVEHISTLAGHRAAVGLGSDMDGGFSALDLPQGINRPAELRLLGDELRARGWNDRDIEGFAWRNWAEFWERQYRRTSSNPVQA